MSEKLQILYMQVRLVRLAAEELNISIEDSCKIFSENAVFQYIENLWDLFHVEGDHAVLEDIREYLTGKGVVL